MSKLTCIIVEDEPLAAKLLADYIAGTDFLLLQGVFKDAIAAQEYLRMQQPDLLFLDMHLPKLKGMDFLRTLVHPPAVIVTTAYHHYAVEGFELNVTDYLLKPFDFDRFLAAVNKVKAGQPNQPAGASAERDFIFIPVQKKKVKLAFADIIYIESQREYIRVVTTRVEYISKMSTHEIERLLPAAQFKRIHRSFIISIGKISSYTAEAVEMSGISIPIGRAYRDGLSDFGT